MNAVQRALREGLSHLAGFACAWSELDMNILAAFLAGFVVVTFGFYKVEQERDKEIALAIAEAVAAAEAEKSDDKESKSAAGDAATTEKKDKKKAKNGKKE